MQVNRSKQKQQIKKYKDHEIIMFKNIHFQTALNDNNLNLNLNLNLKYQDKNSFSKQN